MIYKKELFSSAKILRSCTKTMQLGQFLALKTNQS